MKTRVLVAAIAATLGSAAALAAPNIVVTARSGTSAAAERLADGVVDRAKNNLAVDAAGNTYVVGSRWNNAASEWRFHTTKYTPDGSVLWNATQPADTNNPGELPYAIATDAAGNVYVGGTTYTQYVTIKYDPNGTQLWDKRYSVFSGVYQQPRAMAVDAAGNVYVTGRSQADGFGINDYDYATVKYDTDGNELWVARYDGPDGLEDDVVGLAIDGDGGVYVTGTSKTAAGLTEYATVKYDAIGAQRWTARYGNGQFGDKANAIVVNGDSVVVTGMTNVGSEYNAATVSYDRTTGAQQWVTQLSGTGSGSLRNDAAAAITRDAQGNLYVAGWMWNRDNGFMTAKYDSAGVEQWVRNWVPYNGISGSNAAYSIAAAPDGGVAVAGRAIGFNGFNYGVVKYDAAGTEQWSQLFDGPPGTLTDEAGAVRVRDDGVVVVAGTEAYSQSNTAGTDRRTTLFIVDGVQATTPRITSATSVTGEPYAVNVSVRGKVGFPAGSVLVDDGGGNSCGITLADGDGTCTMPNTGAGTKTLTATYSSDTPTLFASSTGSATHVVNKAATRLAVTTPGLSRPGDSFDVDVDFGVVAPGTGIPAGDIVVSDGIGHCTVARPATRCSLTLTTPGARKVVATYAGDMNYQSVVASAMHRVNRVPVAANDTASLAEDTTLSISAAAGLLANDTDVDNDTLHVVAGTYTPGGIGGTLVLRADGSFDYTPPPDANGVATFAYTLDDGAETATGMLTITVRPVNDPPTFDIGANFTHGAATTGTQTVAGYATNIGFGPADEATQTVAEFLAQIDSDPNDVLDAVSVDANGNLTYVLSGRGGTATVGLRVRDSGGTADGGNDTSTARTFIVTVASGVDLVVAVDNGRRFLPGGGAANYTVDVRNLGPDDAQQAQVSIPQPTNLTGFQWNCTRSDSTPCAVASGSGAVQQTLDVPVGVTVTYAITATVTALPETPVTLSATATAGANQTEVQPTTNTASDTDAVGIFATGFEG